MNCIGIIPSRYASTRFPGKPLADINGKSMIERVYQQALKAKTLGKIIVATDDERIFDHVKNFGGEVCMTSSSHQSGTDRCAEVIEKEKNKFDVAINIQGDEPFIDPVQIDLVANCFNNDQVHIATLAKRIEEEATFQNPNIPKVVLDKNSFAIYFSRYPIPFYKGQKQADFFKTNSYFKHIGIYGYRTNVLIQLTKLPQSFLEKSESLEQLRWIENGYKIKVALTELETIAIDTPVDLKKAISYKL